MRSDSSIVLEMEVSTVSRLLQDKAVTVEDLHSVDSSSKRRLHRLLLEVLKRELGNANIK